MSAFPRSIVMGFTSVSNFTREADNRAERKHRLALSALNGPNESATNGAVQGAVRVAKAPSSSQPRNLILNQHRAAPPVQQPEQWMEKNYQDQTSKDFKREAEQVISREGSPSISAIDLVGGLGGGTDRMQAAAVRSDAPTSRGEGSNGRRGAEGPGARPAAANRSKAGVSALVNKHASPRSATRAASFLYLGRFAR